MKASAARPALDADLLGPGRIGRDEEEQPRLFRFLGQLARSEVAGAAGGGELVGGIHAGRGHAGRHAEEETEGSNGPHFFTWSTNLPNRYWLSCGPRLASG